MQQLTAEASEARSQLTSLVKAQDTLKADTDRRVAAAKAAAAGELEALQARHAVKVRKLQEAAKDQVGRHCVCAHVVCSGRHNTHA